MRLFFPLGAQRQPFYGAASCGAFTKPRISGSRTSALGLGPLEPAGALCVKFARDKGVKVCGAHRAGNLRPTF